MNNKIKNTLDHMIKFKILPDNGFFEITESLLNDYIESYALTNTKLTHNKLSGTNFTYARKLAGYNLTNLLVERGYSKKIKSGFVYVISNPSFSGFYKIGMTKDLVSRLNSYQTYDPHRKYKIETYDFCIDRRLSEKKILTHWNIDLYKGEWVNAIELNIFREILRVHSVTVST